MIFRLPDMLKNAIKSAHYLSVLLPVCWLLWAWHCGGAITLALHFPLAAAGFLMLNNAFTMSLSAIYSQRYDAEPCHFSGVPLVGEIMIYIFKMAAGQAQKWQPSHDWLDVSVWILLPPVVASWLIAPWLWHRLVK